MEVYARVRRAVQVDGMSIREAARQFGVTRKTIRKMMQFFAAARCYERKKPVLKPKLGPWLGTAGHAPLEQIQLSLGHASIQTTERYLGVKQGFVDAPCESPRRR